MITISRIKAGSLRSGRVDISNLKCTVCESVFPIPRIQHREKNHIKDLWCPNCKQITKHLENEGQPQIEGHSYNSKDIPEEVDVDYWLQVFNVESK